jgi:hypothetical protein
VITLNDARTLGRTPLDEDSASSEKPLPNKTQHSQETDFHIPGEIRTRNPNKPAAADPHDRRRGH